MNEIPPTVGGNVGGGNAMESLFECHRAIGIMENQWAKPSVHCVHPWHSSSPPWHSSIPPSRGEERKGKGGKMAELDLHCARDAVGEEAAGGRIQYSTFVPRGPESVELSHISLLHNLKFKKNIENQYKNHTQRRRMDGG